MTILEAIKKVLTQYGGLTHIEVYQKIIQMDLYEFGAKNPIAIVNGYLRRYCEGLDFPSSYSTKYFKIVGKKGSKNVYALNSGDIESIEQSDNGWQDEDILPEERISIAYNDYKKELKRKLLEHVLGCPPGFFEHVVIELLLSMGYGADELSGRVVGRAHDGGIDGIIDEDKLGLSQIYIQAKRQEVGSNIGRPVIQAFVGAMQNVQKGVFITTSSYTKEAIKYANGQQQKSLKLIDGEMLAEFMVKYAIGLEEIQTYRIYKINNDYFE